MAVIEKEAAVVQGGRRGSRMGWDLGGLAILALGAVTVAALLVARTPEATGPAAGSAGVSRAGSPSTASRSRP